MLNAGYIGVMEQAGSDENFAIAYFPPTISILIKEFNNSYEQLGNTRQTIWKDPRNSTWTEPGFAAFIHKNDSLLKPNITGNFTEVQMKGLYSVLSNTTLFHGETLTNTTVRDQCQTNPAASKCGVFAKLAAIANLRTTAMDNSSKQIYKRLVSSVNVILCPIARSSNSCFSRTDLLPNVFLYIKHVWTYTMWVFLEKYEIVSTIPQKDIVLGYKIENIMDPTTGNRYVSIPGIIKVHKTEQDAKNDDKISTFYTCEAGDSKKYQWAG